MKKSDKLVIAINVLNIILMGLTIAKILVKNKENKKENE